MGCLPGLICDYDGWFGTDYCKAGPDTKDFSWSDWGEWSECSVACGGVGSQSRVRSCIPPTNGGYECPSDTDSESQDCNNGPCPGEQFLNIFISKVNLILLLSLWYCNR